VERPHHSPIQIVGFYSCYDLPAWLSPCFHEILNSTLKRFVSTGIFLNFHNFLCYFAKQLRNEIIFVIFVRPIFYQSADKSLARPGRKQARKHVWDARDFNSFETRAVIKFFFPLYGKAPKEIHAILAETLACFLPGGAKDLSASLYILKICIH